MSGEVFSRICQRLLAAAVLRPILHAAQPRAAGYGRAQAQAARLPDRAAAATAGIVVAVVTGPALAARLAEGAGSAPVVATARPRQRPAAAEIGRRRGAIGAQRSVITSCDQDQSQKQSHASSQHIGVPRPRHSPDVLRLKQEADAAAVVQAGLGLAERQGAAAGVGVVAER